MSLSPYITFFTVTEALGLLAALYFLRGGQGLAWQLHGVYLLLALLTDLFGIYIALQHPEDRLANHWVHNLFMLAEGFFVSAMLFERIRELQKCSRWVLYGWLGVFLCSFLYEAIMYRGNAEFLGASYLLFRLVIINACFYYFCLLLVQPDEDPFELPPAFFWVLGTMSFYFGFSVYQGFYHQFAAMQPVWGHRPELLLMDTINLCLYSLWSYSFYKLYRRTRKALTF